jgi:DNA invertase Pin-like site-specific DNA recombinase
MSGAVLERPGLQRLLRDVRAGALDVVLVHKLDRLSRAPQVHYPILDALTSEDVRVISASESFDLDSSSGRLFAWMFSLFIAYERETMIDRIKRAYDEKADEGKWVSG